MTENREAWNTANCRVCGTTALLVAALVGFVDARAETVWRFAQLTALAPDDILDQAAERRETMPARPRQESSSTGNPLWDVALSSLQETRARPLFSPSRRPPSPPVVAAPSPPRANPPPPKEPDRLKLTLLGTVVGASDGIGVFVDEASKEVIRIRIGASHDGWTLRSVQRRAASFEKNHQEATLMFSPPGSEPSAPSAGVVASRIGGGSISGNDAPNLTGAAPILPISAPITRNANKIRQDILSIAVQN